MPIPGEDQPQTRALSKGTGPQRSAAHKELQEIYEGYKLLVLSHGAGTILGEPPARLAEQAARLYRAF